MEALNEPLSEQVTISVERMIRFCYLAEMTREYSRLKPQSSTLKTHLTRFGAMVLESAGFLYSLFEKRSDSINLVKIWMAFDNLFKMELVEVARKLEPFEGELKLVRDRLSFHGSLDRVREKEGLDIFNVDSKRAHDLVDLLRTVQIMAEKMVEWYFATGSVEERENEWRGFILELKGYQVHRREGKLT